MFQLPVECRCVKGGAEIKYRVHTSLVHINTIRHTLTYGKSSNLAYARNRAYKRISNSIHKNVRSCLIWKLLPN